MFYSSMVLWVWRPFSIPLCIFIHVNKIASKPSSGWTVLALICGDQVIVPSGPQRSSSHSPFNHCWHHTVSWPPLKASFFGVSEDPSVHIPCRWGAPLPQREAACTPQSWFAELHTPSWACSWLRLCHAGGSFCSAGDSSCALWCATTTAEPVCSAIKGAPGPLLCALLHKLQPLLAVLLA